MFAQVLLTQQLPASAEANSKLQFQKLPSAATGAREGAAQESWGLGRDLRSDQPCH